MVRRITRMEVLTLDGRLGLPGPLGGEIVANRNYIVWNQMISNRTIYFGTIWNETISNRIIQSGPMLPAQPPAPSPQPAAERSSGTSRPRVSRPVSTTTAPNNENRAVDDHELRDTPVHGKTCTCRPEADGNHPPVTIDIRCGRGHQRRHYISGDGEYWIGFPNPKMKPEKCRPRIVAVRPESGNTGKA